MIDLTLNFFIRYDHTIEPENNQVSGQVTEPGLNLKI